MDIGLVGLGTMGDNTRERLRRVGHTVIEYDRNPDVSDVHSLEELVDKLVAPRVVWVMAPAGEPTRQTIEELGGLLDAGDAVVDGGNSRYFVKEDSPAMKVVAAPRNQFGGHAVTRTAQPGGGPS